MLYPYITRPQNKETFKTSILCSLDAHVCSSAKTYKKPIVFSLVGSRDVLDHIKARIFNLERPNAI